MQYFPVQLESKRSHSWGWEGTSSWLLFLTFFFFLIRILKVFLMLLNIWLSLAEHHPNNCIFVSQCEMMYPYLQPLRPFPEPWCELRDPRDTPELLRDTGGLCAPRRGHSPACRAQELCSTASAPATTNRSNHSIRQGSLPGSQRVTAVTPVWMYTHPEQGEQGCCSNKEKQPVSESHLCKQTPFLSSAIS